MRAYICPVVELLATRCVRIEYLDLLGLLDELESRKVAIPELLEVLQSDYFLSWISRLIKVGFCQDGHNLSFVRGLVFYFDEPIF